MKKILGNQDKDVYSFGKSELKEFPLIPLPSVHVYDLKFSNQPDEDHIYIPGKVFLAPAANDYYHAVLDTMSHYEMIKEVYPDIKIIFCSNDNMYTINRYLNIDKDYMRNVLDFYNVKYEDILDIKNQNYIFEEVIHLPSRSQWNQDRIVPYDIQQDLRWFTHPECWEYRPLMIDYLKKAIQPFIIEKEPKKIYSARIPYTYTPTDISKYSEEDQEYIKFRKLPIGRGYEDEGKLIDYFLDKGYSIMNFNKMSLIDQLSECFYATELAGINGSNVFNFCWAKPETKASIVLTTNSWGYDFWYYLKHCKIDYTIIGQEESNKYPYLDNVVTNGAVMSPPPDLKKLYFSDVNVLIKELNEKQFN